MTQSKFALITGGTSGIGLSIALKLCVRYNLILVFKNNSERADLARQQILQKSPSCNVQVVQCDIKSIDLVQCITESIGIDKFNKIEVLINNGGSIDRSPVLISNPENAINCIQEHLFSSIRLVHALVPVFKINGGGKFIHISSLAVISPWIGSLGYTVAKSALLGLSRSLVCELTTYGITSNCILPGMIETPSTESVIRVIKNDTAYSDKSRFLGRTEVIANTVEFLLNNENSHINGADMIIDGGYQYSLKNVK